MDFGSLLFFVFALMFLITWKGVVIVPAQSVWIVEKLGRFDRKLEPGLNILVPFVERIAYRHSLGELCYNVQTSDVLTRDEMKLTLDGLIYIRIVDPIQASYGVTDPVLAVTQLAQTTIRSEIGKLILDERFINHEALNTSIVHAINDASRNWGIECTRHEIKNMARSQLPL